MNTFNKVALEVLNKLNSRLSASDRDAEWQRVNSYIADVLKDAHVLYAKLARLQGDFAGTELESLEHISEDVLDIGGKLSSFSKAFYEGKLDMAKEGAYGEETFGGTSPEPQAFHSERDHEESEHDSDSGEGDVDVEFDYETSDKDDESEDSEDEKK